MYHSKSSLEQATDIWCVFLKAMFSMSSSDTNDKASPIKPNDKYFCK